jgi:hypothetical protein
LDKLKLKTQLPKLQPKPYLLPFKVAEPVGIAVAPVGIVLVLLVAVH